MSYHRPNTGNPELDRKLIQEDYDMLLHHVLEAPTHHGFDCWLDKLALIDQEAITGHVREHWDELDRGRRLRARLRLSALRDLPTD